MAAQDVLKSRVFNFRLLEQEGYPGVVLRSPRLESDGNQVLRGHPMGGRDPHGSLTGLSACFLGEGIKRGDDLQEYPGKQQVPAGFRGPSGFEKLIVGSETDETACRGVSRTKTSRASVTTASE